MVFFFLGRPTTYYVEKKIKDLDGIASYKFQLKVKFSENFK